MKNYEYFNKQFGDNEPAEVQALKTVITDLCNDNSISIDDETMNGYVTLFKLKLEWLNREKGE